MLESLLIYLSIHSIAHSFIHQTLIRCLYIFVQVLGILCATSLLFCRELCNIFPVLWVCWPRWCWGEHQGTSFHCDRKWKQAEPRHSQNVSAFHLSSFQDDISFLGKKACPFKHSNIPLKIFSTNLIGADCMYHAITWWRHQGLLVGKGSLHPTLHGSFLNSHVWFLFQQWGLSLEHGGWMGAAHRFTGPLIIYWAKEDQVL